MRIHVPALTGQRSAVAHSVRYRKQSLYVDIFQLSIYFAFDFDYVEQG